jgi:hypothetical protein
MASSPSLFIFYANRYIIRSSKYRTTDQDQDLQDNRKDTDNRRPQAVP